MINTRKDMAHLYKSMGGKWIVLDEEEKVKHEFDTEQAAREFLEKLYKTPG